MDLEAGLARSDSLLRKKTRLAVLFGSRVTGRIHAGSDVDVGVLMRPGVDPLVLQGELSGILGTDAVDLVNLNRCSGLLQHVVATRGRLLWEDRPGHFAEFAALAERRWGDERRTIPLEWQALRSWLQKRGIA